MKDKFIFIVNPKAGKNGRAVDFITQIEAAAKAFALDYELYITKSAGDALEFTRTRCRNLQQPTRFFACGGDGTMNEVINGAVGTPGASVGVLPLGSGNDYIKAFGAADFLNMQAQIEGAAVPVDLIRVGSRYVANMCNIGFDASVAHNFIKFKSKPGISGPMAYSMSVFYTLSKKISTPMTITLDDGTEIYDDMLLCSVSKGIYCGGQYKTAPNANPTDGFLDVCPIRKISRAKFLQFFNLYKDGKHFESPAMQGIVSYHKCRRVTIRGVQQLPACFDGEPAFLSGAVTFEVVPAALPFILPAQTVKNKDVEKAAAEIFKAPSLA